MYIFPEDAFRMHRSFFKEIALSYIYRKEIAKRRQEVNEITEMASNSPAGEELLFYNCAPLPVSAKKWQGPSLENRALSKKFGLGEYIDILA
ncbi:MAG: hypothetical protein WC435_00525 [Candidatus Paceibacterota bacterium]